MRYRVFVLSVTALLVSCSTGTQCESSVITDEGLEGNWEIYQRTDTVTMLPAFLQGEDLIITDDSLCGDLQGLWEYRASNSENGGEFTLDTALQEIIFLPQRIVLDGTILWSITTIWSSNTTTEASIFENFGVVNKLVREPKQL